MKAMTMAFPVRRHLGTQRGASRDTMRATLVVADKCPSGKHLHYPIPPRGRSIRRPRPVHLPQKGELVPDFHFVNQNARPIHLAQFRGEPLLLTFIYSRCPLPDYCVRMSNNFAEVARILQNPTRPPSPSCNFFPSPSILNLMIQNFVKTSKKTRNEPRRREIALAVKFAVDLRECQEVRREDIINVE